MTSKFKKIISNRVIIYLISRYGTFIIQFISSIYLALKLGPYQFGVWSFILLIINYLNYTNFGIPNSLNILLIQSKENKKVSNDLILNSFILNVILSFLIIALEVYYFTFGISFFDKYELNNYFIAIGLIGVLFHFNSIFGTISRINNRLFELGVFQSIIPLLVFITILVFDSKYLLIALLYATLTGHIISLATFFYSRQFSFSGKLNFRLCKKILGKGFYLFIYNVSFLFIVISTRTMISYYYDVDDYGIFNFSYTIANSILLLLQGLSIVVFPKIIDKLNSKDHKRVLKAKYLINQTYVTLAYTLVFCGISVFPFLIKYFADYKNSSFTVCLIAIIISLSTNVFANTSLLMARNLEKKLALISIFSLVINIISCYLLVSVFELHYKYIILATLLSYLIFGVYSSKWALEITNSRKVKLSEIIFDFLPIRILIPFILTLILIVNDLENYNIIIFLLFLSLNSKELSSVYNTTKTILDQPKFIDLE